MIINKLNPGKVSGSGWFACALSISLFLFLFACTVVFPAPVLAQGGPTTTPTPGANETPLEAPENVEVEPAARDEEISERHSIQK